MAKAKKKVAKKAPGAISAETVEHLESLGLVSECGERPDWTPEAKAEMAEKKAT